MRLFIPSFLLFLSVIISGCTTAFIAQETETIAARKMLIDDKLLSVVYMTKTDEWTGVIGTPLVMIIDEREYTSFGSSVFARVDVPPGERFITCGHVMAGSIVKKFSLRVNLEAGKIYPFTCKLDSVRGPYLKLVSQSFMSELISSRELAINSGGDYTGIPVYIQNPSGIK